MNHFIIWAITIVISGLIGLTAVLIFVSAVIAEIKEHWEAQIHHNNHKLAPQ